MKQLFHIQNNGADKVQQVLSLSFGEKHGSFAITNKAGNQLYELAYCETREWDEAGLANFYSSFPSLKNAFYQVLISYDYPESILTPSVVNKPEESQLLSTTMHGVGTGSHIISEAIPEWQMADIYSVPNDLYKWAGQVFPASRSWHQYSLGVKKIKAASAEGSMLVDFKKEDFTLLVAAKDRLLLARSFPYKTPADVLYYLLNVCRQFSLSQNKVNVQISGLVDKNSALYKELYQYFIQIHFRDASWNTGDEYPAHFFTTLNDLAQCAS